MNLTVLLVCFATHLFADSNVQALITSNTNQNYDWNLDEVLSMITNDTARSEKIDSFLLKLLSKADQLYHKAEGKIKDRIHTIQQDPVVVNKYCSCFCRCPQNTIENKAIQDVKLEVSNLKDRLINLGISIKNKIHHLTAP